MVAGRPPPSFCNGPMPYDCGSNGKPGKPAKHEGYFPAFVNNLVSPFMSCWQPPINSCVSPRRPSGGPVPVVSPQQSKSMPVTDIREPHSNDVLCGRGGSSNRHVGNLNFRSLVAANKDMYVTLTKKQKMTVARKIVDAIHNQSPQGRFLQKDSVTGLWFDIGLPRSLEKTSQALREKTGMTLESPASPGGSSVTAMTMLSEETFSDPGVQPSTAASKTPPSTPTPVSPPGTASSSPVPSAMKVNPNEVPEISIPEHLEEQFRPQVRRVAHRPPPPPPPPIRYDYYPPAYPHHPAYSHRGPPPPSQPYPPHHDYYGRPPPPPHYSYPPHVTMDPRHRPRPYPPSTYSSPHHVPPSPDRRDYHYHDPRQQQQPPPPPSKHPSPPQQLLLPPTNYSNHVVAAEASSTPERKTNGSRQTTEVSPGRAQVWKKRRGTDEAVLLSRTSQWSLSESATPPSQPQQQQPPSSQQHPRDLTSPSSVLQSRSRRGIATTANSVTPDSKKPSDDGAASQSTGSSAWSRSVNRGDALAGLAALSSAALLKLDAEGK